MKDCSRRGRASWWGTLALIACVLPLTTGCGLFVGKYKMEIRPTANLESQLQSLYVIVSQREQVAEPLLTASRYRELLEEDRIRKYTTFVQFQPEGGTWKQTYTGPNQNEYVTIKPDEELIKIKISHKLIDKSGALQFNVVVLAFFGSEGFEQVTVDHIALDSNADQVLLISAGSLSLQDS